MKINWFKALGMVSMVAGELNEALVDGKISFEEGVVAFSRICKTAGIEFDDKGISFALDLMNKISNAASDKKITIKEAIEILEMICEKLGIELDKTGFEIK